MQPNSHRHTLRRHKTKTKMNMNKTLKVVKPFMHLVPGDTFEANNDGTYTAEQNEEFNRTDDTFGDFKSSISSKFTVSEDYIKELAKNGIVESKKSDKQFVNVFDEIDNMLDTYKHDLSTVNTEMEHAPECVKLEKVTVLKNLIKALDHLKNLKK